MIMSGDFAWCGPGYTYSGGYDSFDEYERGRGGGDSDDGRPSARKDCSVALAMLRGYEVRSTLVNRPSGTHEAGFASLLACLLGTIFVFHPISPSLPHTPHHIIPNQTPNTTSPWT